MHLLYTQSPTTTEPHWSRSCPSTWKLLVLWSVPKGERETTGHSIKSLDHCLKWGYFLPLSSSHFSEQEDYLYPPVWVLLREIRGRTRKLRKMWTGWGPCTVSTCQGSGWPRDGLLECEAAAGRGQDHPSLLSKPPSWIYQFPAQKPVSSNTTLSSFKGG